MPGKASDVAGLPPARLRVRLLGAAEVLLDGHRLPAFDSPRLQRFLALLVLRRQALQRAKTAFELWPDSDESQARTNLRKLLHDLRRSLPDVERFVEIGNDTVRWIPDGGSDVDVLKFRDAIAAGDLELAARTYCGDLLPACYDDWVLDERAKLRNEAHEILARLIREAAEREDYDLMLRSAQRILELEPSDEVAVKAQMDAYLALGDRAEALRSYHRYAEALERDLGLSPSDAIGARYRELRGDPSEREPGPGDDPSSIAESPFVGRGPEWQQLVEAWDLARGGSAHLVLISGEAGVGKSRLAEEFGRRVRADGYPVASARAYEAAGRLPWGPVVDLLRADALCGQVETLETPWRAELARLLPELLDDAFSPESVPVNDQTQRHRLFDAISQAIVGGDRPRLLIIDDLQWCDAETIELIGFLVHSRSTAPILVIATVRTEEIPDGHPLVGLVDALTHDQAMTAVPLDRFDESTTATLAARMRGAESIDKKLAARIWNETEGNPLFIVETLRAGISADGSEAVLTPTMRVVLRARLDQLSEGARRIAEVAAVIGRPFSIGLLAAASGSDDQEIVARIDELWRRRIIRDQGFRYDFSHDKLRAIALELIGPARRRRFHAAVAAALALEAQDDSAAASPRLAAHYDQAGMIEPAIEAYRLAGARAVAVSALDEAIAMFRRALALLSDLPPSATRDGLELDIRIALGSPLVAVEGYGSKASHRLYERTLALCRRLEKPANPPILRGLGLARLQGCRFDDCDGFARSLLEQQSRDPIALTEGRYLLGVSAFWQGDLATARRYLDGAIEAYDPARRAEHLASYAQDPKAICLVRRGLAELWAGDIDRAFADAESALELANELDHLMTLAYVYTYAAILVAETGDLAHLAELLQEADRLWQRLMERYLVVVLDALRGWLEVCDGEAAGVEKIVRSVARSRTDGETLHLSYTLLLLARARASLGEYHEGRAAIRDAIAWTHDRQQRYLEAELWRVDGELVYGLGEAETAMASWRKAVDAAHAQGAGWLELRALHALVSRFPDRALHERLAELVETIPASRDLPAFRAARSFLQESG